jgi:hypothetical protein
MAESDKTESDTMVDKSKETESFEIIDSTVGGAEVSSIHSVTD